MKSCFLWFCNIKNLFARYLGLINAGSFWIKWWKNLAKAPKRLKGCTEMHLNLIQYSHNVSRAIGQKVHSTWCHANTVLQIKLSCEHLEWTHKLKTEVPKPHCNPTVGSNGWWLADLTSPLLQWWLDLLCNHSFYRLNGLRKVGCV